MYFSSLVREEFVPLLSGPNSTAEELGRATVKPSSDFVIRDRFSNQQKTALLAIQAILFPWGLYRAVKYCLQRLIMIPHFQHRKENPADF